MGFGGISPLSLLLILAIIVLLFGTKKLRNLGGDLGSAIRSFKNAVTGGEAGKAKPDKNKQLDEAGGRVIDAEVEHKDSDKV